jgi:hypothetical protein
MAMWSSSLLFLLSSEYWQRWIELVKDVYRLWWNKGRWFIITVLLTSMFQYDALLLNVPENLFLIYILVGAIGWIVSLYMLYIAVHQALCGDKRLLLWRSYGSLLILFIAMRMMLVFGMSFFDPFQGLTSFLPKPLSAIVYGLLAPFGLADITSLVPLDWQLYHADRLVLDCASFFILFMFYVIHAGVSVRSFLSACREALKSTFYYYPFVLVFFYASICVLALSEKVVELVLRGVFYPIYNEWVPGFIAIPVFVIARWLLHVPWPLLMLPCILANIVLFYQHTRKKI